MTTINFVKLSSRAKTPTRQTPFSAGADLYASETKNIPAHGRALVPTDLRMGIPTGYYGRIAPRSGLAFSFGLHVGAGVVDSDYRGGVFVLLFNHGDMDYLVRSGDRIAQIIIEKTLLCTFRACLFLDDTSRGSGACGSTGLR